MNTLAKNSSAPDISRQVRKTRATRKRLLRAASALFAEKGIDLTTIDDITQRADLAKGTFYYHFNDKNEVIAELIEQLLGQLTALMKNRCQGIEELGQLLNTIITVHVEFFSTRWEDFVLYYQGRADLKLKEGYSGLEIPFIRYLEAIEHIIDPAIRHRLDSALLRRIGCAVAGFLSGYYSFAAIASEDEDVDANLLTLRSALVSSMTKFIQGAMAADHQSDS